MMTREEAIEVLENGGWWDSLMPVTTIEGRIEDDKLHEALDLAIAALRPVSREQVEKGRWVKIYEDGEPYVEQSQIGVACSKCMKMPEDKFTESKFCPNCGRPMTDEAVQMVMERLEALKDGNT